MPTVREQMRVMAQDIVETGCSQPFEQEKAERLARLVLENLKNTVNIGMIFQEGKHAPLWIAARNTHDEALTWAREKAKELSTPRSPISFCVDVVVLP